MTVSDDESTDVLAGNQAAINAMNTTMPNVQHICQNRGASSSSSAGMRPPPPPPGPPPADAMRVNNDPAARAPDMRTAAAASAVRDSAGDVDMPTTQADDNHTTTQERVWAGQHQTVENDRVRQAVDEQTGQTESRVGDATQTGQLLQAITSGNFEDNYTIDKGHHAGKTTDEKKMYARLKDVSDLSTVDIEEGLVEDKAEWASITKGWMRRAVSRRPQEAYEYVTTENIRQLQNELTTKLFLAAPIDGDRCVSSKVKIREACRTLSTDQVITLVRYANQHARHRKYNMRYNQSRTRREWLSSVAIAAEALVQSNTPMHITSPLGTSILATLGALRNGRNTDQVRVLQEQHERATHLVKRVLKTLYTCPDGRPWTSYAPHIQSLDHVANLCTRRLNARARLLIRATLSSSYTYQPFSDSAPPHAIATVQSW